MSSLLALIVKELRVLAHDRHGLLVLFLMPAIFILIMSLVLRAPIAERNNVVTHDVLVVDQDRGALAGQLLQQLEHSGHLHAVELAKTAGRAALAERLQRSGAEFGLLIPADFTRRMQQRTRDLSGAAQQTRGMLTLYYAPTTLPQARTLFEVSLTATLEKLQGQLLFAQLMGSGGTLPQAGALPPVPVDQVVAGQSGEGRLPNAVQQSVPAWLVFAMFFVVIPISTALIVERQQGSLLRLKSLGIPSLTVMLARVPPYYLVNLVQMLLMLAVGVWVVPLAGGDRLDLGHAPFGLFLIGSATSVAAIGMALLIAVLVRTSVQATTVGGVISLVLGALGGIMVPKQVMTPVMQHIADFSPMSWGLDGFLNVILRGQGWTSVLPEAAKLVAFGLVCLILAALLFRRRA
ncbi:MAG: ABC transporter permease [Gammaproteobacteria bacterium]